MLCLFDIVDVCCVIFSRRGTATNNNDDRSNKKLSNYESLTRLLTSAEGLSSWGLLSSYNISNYTPRWDYVFNFLMFFFYDFSNPQRQEAVDAYNAMSPFRKPFEVIRRSATLNPALMGMKLASELGNAYIGNEGRDVNIKFNPQVLANSLRNK